MKLSIITINYNGSENTIKLLDSLKDQTDKDFKLILVDNASDEADFRNLEHETQGAILIRNEENLGFSGGNNVGIRKALENGADWVILLNSDTLVDRSFIASLRAKLGSLEGIVGIPLIEGDHVAYAGKIKWFRSTLNHIHNPSYTDYLRKGTNNFAIGGAIAIYKDVFDKIGFWDEEYFLYFEDADFNIRARNSGISINFIDEPKIKHQVSATTKKLGSPLLLRYHYRNAFYFNLNNGPWYVKILIWPWSFWIMKKQLFKIMFMYKREQSFAILSGVIDFYKNRMGKI